MMKHLNRLVLAGLLALIPNVASAGWLGWFYSLDPKMVGSEYEFHVLCLDETGKSVWCEKLLGLRQADPIIKIKHEIGLRYGYAHNFGDRFPDDPSDKGSIKAIDLMGTYYYRLLPNDDRLSVGVAAGYMFFYGKAADGQQNFDSFKRFVVNPGVRYFPLKHVSGSWASGWNLRFDGAYIKKGFNGADFGNHLTGYQTHGGEWTFGLGGGFDFRRR